MSRYGKLLCLMGTMIVGGCHGAGAMVAPEDMGGSTTPPVVTPSPDDLGVAPPSPGEDGGIKPPPPPQEDGGIKPPPPPPPPPPHQGTTIHDVYVTWYGFNDNSCQVETQHDCNTIAFPKSDGWPVPHNIATEGKGTFQEPSTFATAAMDSGSPAELAPGTRIYVPEVHKYFIMEDQCKECGQQWFPRRSYHVDLWMGPSFGSANGPLMDCEGKLTLGNPFAGTGTIVVDPPPDLPVDTNPLFTNDTCTAHTYAR
jgi:hypothetical protein